MDQSGDVTPYVIFVLLVYFIPCIVVAIRRHPNGVAIALVNLFLGWTLLGWVVALVWSASAFNRS